MTSDADSDEATDALVQQWCELKSALIEGSLGKAHDVVMHALIPYCVGGPLDLYYYPHGVAGTAIATQELSERPNEGPSNDLYRSYELVMFTKHRLDLNAAQDETTAFGRAHASMSAILNCIARYSSQASLNPRETCEFPEEMERIGGKCLVFDGYACHSEGLADHFGLLAIIEVFRSEMEFARQHGGAALLKRLKSGGYYPYSDLDRESVA